MNFFSGNPSIKSRIQLSRWNDSKAEAPNSLTMIRFDEQEQKVTITISMIMTFLFLIDFGYWHVKLFVCHLIVFVMYYTKEETSVSTPSPQWWLLFDQKQSVTTLVSLTSALVGTFYSGMGTSFKEDGWTADMVAQLISLRFLSSLSLRRRYICIQAIATLLAI